jgi:F-type H+-transporting ATPase subunit b
MTLPIAAAASAEAGIAQLNFATWPSQIFWAVVSLVVLFFILKNVALPKIAGVLEERSDAIADDLDRAAEFKRKAEEAQDAYDKALADARAKAQAIAAETRAEIQKDVDAANAKAEAEIAAKTAEGEARIKEIRDSAMAHVEEVSLSTAEALVQAVAPGASAGDAIKKAVSGRLGG